jgi:hypothetical protein
MKKLLLLLLPWAFPLATVFGQAIIPTTQGTTWSYLMTEEPGEGLRFAEVTPDVDGRVRMPVIYRVGGTNTVDGKPLLRFEMHRGGVVSNTDLVTVDAHGMVCAARISPDGGVTKLDPPQTMIAAPLKIGSTWNFTGIVNGASVHQQYEVTAEEDVGVPAGLFRAWHIHGEQTLPNPTTVDRWFVNGTGIVKDVTTIRSTEGVLLRRITLELTERPKITARPEVKPSEPPKKLTVTLGKGADGESATSFASDTPAIYARWRGHELRPQAEIRAAWIAENIGDVAAPNYTIDEATATVTAPDSRGIFMLSKPEGGWKPGDYRVELYLDDMFVEAVKLKIAK